MYKDQWAYSEFDFLNQMAHNTICSWNVVYCAYKQGKVCVSVCLCCLTHTNVCWPAAAAPIQRYVDEKTINILTQIHWHIHVFGSLCIFRYRFLPFILSLASSIVLIYAACMQCMYYSVRWFRNRYSSFRKRRWERAEMWKSTIGNG